MSPPNKSGLRTPKPLLGFGARSLKLYSASERPLSTQSGGLEIPSRRCFEIAMTERNTRKLGLLLILLGIFGCSDSSDSPPPQEEPVIAFEVLEIQSLSPTSIITWLSIEPTPEEFEAIELEPGWFKNQPREAEECGADDSRFIKSPDSTEDGDIRTEEIYGFDWFHSATITQRNVPLDDEGLLTGFLVRKFHELTFNAGSCLVLLISPEGDVYFRIGRDATRVSDEPSIPNLWRLEEYTTPTKLVIELFDENVVIRTDNQDSFQGPVPELEGVL